MEDSKLIYEFQKNAQEKVRIEFCKFKKRDLINVRVWYLADELGEVWKPSPKGITMDVDLIEELKQGVDKALKEWQKRIYNPN